MAVYSRVPARIIVRDLVGVSEVAEARYRKVGEAELNKLEGQVLRGILDQGVRRVMLGENVQVEATVMFGLKQAVVTIGANPMERLVEESCYCCSPCLVAAIITRIAQPTFPEEDDHRADILLCQKPSEGDPKRITVYDEYSSGGVTSMRERVVLHQGHSGWEVADVPFSDLHAHRVGGTVLVLVQPLYEFSPACLDAIPACDNVVGEYSPCVNDRAIASEQVLNTRILITGAYVNSTGNTCQVMWDQHIWTPDPEVPEYDALRHFPFRILPIRIESCL